MSTCSVLCKILFCHEANPLFTCYLHACSSNTNVTIFDDWRKFWAINQSFNNKFRKLYYPTLVSVWCLAGEEKTRFAWDWGRDWSSESTKKECYENRFFGIRELWPGVGISKQHGGKIPDRKYAGEAGAENTPPSQTKKIQLWDIKDFENFPPEVKKILRKKARWPLLLVQHVQFSKLKYSYNLNDRVFLFSAKTYQILWTRCLLLSIWSVTKQNEV